MHYTILPLGDSALTLDFGNHISEQINNKVHSLAGKIEKAALPAIKDIVPAYSSITIHYDPIWLLKHYNTKTAFKLMSDQIEMLLLQPAEDKAEECRTVNIPVCYSLKYGLDLPEISAQTRLSIDEIISLHTGKKYKVYMIGFLPGFAYIGNVDDRIAVPRKIEPRQKIDAGYVGIAGKQTGIYSLTSPGGWQIIGKTPLKLFDKTQEHPVFFRSGDEVSFYPISEDELNNY